MKTLVKNFWFTLITFFVLTISAEAQVKGPTETKKQAETEVWGEQKREKARQKRGEKASNQEISQLNTSPKYKRVVRKKEKQLLKPIIVTKERKN